MVAAGGEHAGVGAAPVEPEHDLGVLAGDASELGQGGGQAHAQPGRLAGGEADRPAGRVGDHGVDPARLGVPTFGVPALTHRQRAGVGHEVLVDEVHPRGARVGGEHRRGEGPL